MSHVPSYKHVRVHAYMGEQVHRVAMSLMAAHKCALSHASALRASRADLGSRGPVAGEGGTEGVVRALKSMVSSQPTFDCGVCTDVGLVLGEARLRLTDGRGKLGQPLRVVQVRGVREGRGAAPSSRSGDLGEIHVGDILLEIDRVSVFPSRGVASLALAHLLLRGPAGSTVEIQGRRASLQGSRGKNAAPAPFQITMMRTLQPLPPLPPLAPGGAGGPQRSRGCECGMQIDASVTNQRSLSARAWQVEQEAPPSAPHKPEVPIQASSLPILITHTHTKP